LIRKKVVTYVGPLILKSMERERMDCRRLRYSDLDFQMGDVEVVDVVRKRGICCGRKKRIEVTKWLGGLVR